MFLTIILICIAIKFKFKADQWAFMLGGILFWTLFLIGCAQPSGSSSGQSTKSMFSQWSQVADHTRIIDLSAGSIGTSFVENYPTAVCSSDTILVGDETSGTMTITNGRSSTSTPDPSCSAVNGTYTYSKTDTNLTVCISVSDCAIFQ